MTDTLTLRYDNETNRVTQTYWGVNPDWKTENGTTITETGAGKDVRQQEFEDALSAVSESDYNPDTETPVPYLTYDPKTDSMGAEVEIQPLPDSLQA